LPADGAPAWLALETLPAVGGAIEFGEDDSHYLRRVCRVRAGERITATDGVGGVAEITLDGSGRELRGVVERRETRERGPEACVLCGAPEGERGLVDRALAGWGSCFKRSIASAASGMSRAPVRTLAAARGCRSPAVPAGVPAERAHTVAARRGTRPVGAGRFALAR
jgi:hypothetical protein